MIRLNNIYKLETRLERDSFFRGVWKTDLFKKLANDPESLVGSIREKYCDHVRYYYHMQNKDLERSAFTSWYSILSLKNYENDYIHDLYVLHELTHQATMPYVEGLTFAEWQDKMIKNEVEASLISEVFFYLENPDVRSKTFKFEIWADQFLTKEYIESYHINKSVVQSEILAKRISLYDNPQNKVEEELANFKKFSYHFYNVWKRDFNKIESNVLRLKTGDHEAYDLFLLSNIGREGILFEDLIRKHYANYLKFNFKRPHY